MDGQQPIIELIIHWKGNKIKDQEKEAYDDGVRIYFHNKELGRLFLL